MVFLEKVNSKVFWNMLGKELNMILKCRDYNYYGDIIRVVRL